MNTKFIHIFDACDMGFVTSERIFDNLNDSLEYLDAEYYSINDYIETFIEDENGLRKINLLNDLERFRKEKQEEFDSVHSLRATPSWK